MAQDMLSIDAMQMIYKIPYGLVPTGVQKSFSGRKPRKRQEIELFRENLGKDKKLSFSEKTSEKIESPPPRIK